MKEPEDRPAGLYVHVPFCRTKCLYCDFYSVPGANLSAEWLRALEQEAGLYKGQFPVFDTLYLGGGTPTVLTGDEFARLMGILYRARAVSPRLGALAFGDGLSGDLSAPPGQLRQRAQHKEVQLI